MHATDALKPSYSFAFLFALFLPQFLSAEEGYEGDVTDVVTIDSLDFSGPYKRIWEPHLAKWSDRHLVCCYGLELRGKSDMGDIVCSISTDAGKTWNPPTMVFDHRQRNGTQQFAYNNSVLFRPPGQDVIWLFCMRAPLHYRDSENADIVAAYTADGGYSWKHVELSNNYQGPLIIVCGIETVMRDGIAHYLLPAHRNSRRHDKHGDRRQFILESTSLLRWKLRQYIETDDPVFLHEGKIARTGRGNELQIMMRTANIRTEKALDTPLAYSATSSDGGKTWSEGKPEPDLPNHRAKSFFGRSASGKQIYVYSDQYDHRGMSYKTRVDGKDWSARKVFYFHNNRNSYPTLIEDKPDQWLAVWDSSNHPDRRRTIIRFGRLDTRR